MNDAIRTGITRSRGVKTHSPTPKDSTPIATDARACAGQYTSVLKNSQSLLVTPDVTVQQMESDVAATAGTRSSTGPSTAVGTGATTGTGHTGGGTELSGHRHRPTPNCAASTARWNSTPAVPDETPAGLPKRSSTDSPAYPARMPKSPLEIQVEVLDSIPENAIRTVTENCRTLKFKSRGIGKS